MGKHTLSPELFTSRMSGARLQPSSKQTNNNNRRLTVINRII